VDDRAQRILTVTRIALLGLAGTAVLATLSCTSSSGGAAVSSAAAATSTGASAAAPASSAPAASGQPSAPSGSAPSTVPVLVPSGTIAPYPTTTRGATPATDQTKVLNTLPGDSAADTCVAVGTHTTVRSGAIAAGNFVSARSSFRSQYRKTELPEVTMYVIPQHAAHLTSATITVTARSNGATKSVTTKSVQSGDAAQYFVAQVPVATPGAYRLTMASGSDRGCFLVTFTG
jgi:hypothetical protein